MSRSRSKNRAAATTGHMQYFIGWMHVAKSMSATLKTF